MHFSWALPLRCFVARCLDVITSSLRALTSCHHFPRLLGQITSLHLSCYICEGDTAYFTWLSWGWVTVCGCLIQCPCPPGPSSSFGALPLKLSQEAVSLVLVTHFYPNKGVLRVAFRYPTGCTNENLICNRPLKTVIKSNLDFTNRESRSQMLKHPITDEETRQPREEWMPWTTALTSSGACPNAVGVAGRW